MNRLDNYAWDAARREARRTRPMRSGNKVRRQKAQADAELYRAMAIKIAQNRPDLSNNVLAEIIWKALPLPEEKRPSVDTIRKKLPKK
jgi:hypothetical protein